MKIVLNAEPFGYSEKAIARWGEKGYAYIPSSWQEVVQGKFPDIHGLIVRLQRKVDAFILDKFPDLEFIVSATTGWDHLDTQELERRNIRLISLRGEGDFLRTIPSTAEHTWALLMALIRNIPAANQDVLGGNWQRDHFRGYQLKDKTIGIIGYGRTGQRVASYADAFLMKVIFYDPNVAQGAERHLKVDKLEELLQQSDIISLHVHLKPDTERLLNAVNISKIKKGAYLLNTSRGKLWDEKALVQVIRSQQIAGIATDVLHTELEDVTESPLWQAQQERKNIIITPHIGGATWDAMWACEEFITSLVLNEMDR